MAFGEYDTNEMRYAEELVPRVPEHSLTAFDKGFSSAAILVDLAHPGEERHFLIPSKAHTKWEVLSGSPDDAVVQMKVSPQARRKHPDLPETWEARALQTVLPDGRERIRENLKAALQ